MHHLPSLIVIGAMKSGTTSLHHYLGAHPDIFVPEVKELDYFVRELNWDRGLDWYRRQYRGAQGRLGADVSPNYSKHPYYAGVPERIAATVPEATIGYVVRDPIRRIESMYRHQVAMGRERRAVDVAVLDDPHYVETSSYAMQLGRYVEHFDRSQIHVIGSTGLRRDPVGSLRVLTDALGLAPMREVPAGEWNRSDEKGRARLVTRAALKVPKAQRMMRTLPEPVRRRVRQMGHRPIDPAIARISPTTEAELRRRLRPDVEELETWLPGVLREWRFTTR